MSKNNPLPIVGSLYANYIIQSIALITIMQFSVPLMAQFHTDVQGLGKIAAGIGIGKVLFMFLGGVLSDKFGRKPFIYLGMICYAIFFLGMIHCTDTTVAFYLAVIVGAGNSFLDTGSMPALTECYPHSAGTASVLIKAFISIGTLVLPLIVTVIYQSQIWYGWAFIGFSVYLLINGLLLAPRRFPSKDTLIASADKTIPCGCYFTGQPKIYIEGLCLILMGFTTTATFVVIMQWMPEIAIRAVNMAEVEAKQLISYYSTGSIISVFLTAFLVKKFLKPVQCIIILPFLSACVLLVFYLSPTPLVCRICAFFMGVTAAGGVLQLTLVVMQQLFPKFKGIAVGVMYTLSGISFYIVPSVVPKLAATNVKYAILFDLFIACASVLLAIIVYSRFRLVIDMKKI
ncbi:MFS transporter [Utexia brackfieldae]|uniref:MFS transporter n=1 Tax=Utexia brackfieldae TaxID=3074108 RepID=UPI00370D1CD5